MKLFKKEELKILWPFYAERFLAHLIYFAPAFWILQFQQNFSLTQIGLLFGILSISHFIFEIPTGAFADIYGRKVSTLFGYFMTGIVMLSLYFAHNFYYMLILFSLWGLAGTFISGARESWVVDRIKAHKRANLIRDFYIKEQSIVRLSLFLSGLLGALIVSKFGLDIIWLFAGLSFLASGIMLIFIREFKLHHNKKQSFSSIVMQAKNSIKYSWKHHALFFLLTATFFIMFRDSVGGDLVWQPFLKNLGFPVFAFGILFSIITLIGTFTPFFANPILKKFRGERDYLAFLLVCSIILDILVLTVGSYAYGIVILLFMFISVDLFAPIGSSYFQKQVPSRRRATITSLQGMIRALAYAISMPLSGFVADHIGPKYTIVTGAIFLVPALILYLSIKEKKK